MGNRPQRDPGLFGVPFTCPECDDEVRWVMTQTGRAMVDLRSFEGFTLEGYLPSVYEARQVFLSHAPICGKKIQEKLHQSKLMYIQHKAKREAKQK